MSDSYFVVSSSADGVHFDKIDEQELLDRFKGTGDDRYYGDEVPNIPTGRIDLQGDSHFFIIKGDFVTMTPKEVVREWEIS